MLIKMLIVSGKTSKKTKKLPDLSYFKVISIILGKNMKKLLKTQNHSKIGTFKKNKRLQHIY